MDLKIIILIAAVIVLFVGLEAALICMGYWMGRNSAEKPLRSLNNPAKASKYTAPVPEPAGDVFNDAAYGEPDDSQPGISTLKMRRR